MKHQQLLGCDAEFFVHGPSAMYFRGVLASLAERLPPKGERFDLGGGYWTHRDGFAVEVGFEPVHTPVQFVQRLDTARALASQHVGYDLSATRDAIEFPQTVLEKHHDDALVQSSLRIGCAEDYVATLHGPQRRVVPKRVINSPVREAGLHIHLSLPRVICKDSLLVCEFVRQLDEVAWPVYQRLTNAPENTDLWFRQRRVYRHKPYGVEYRSLPISLTANSSHLSEVLDEMHKLQSTWWEYDV